MDNPKNSIFGISEWFRGLTLEERSQSLKITNPLVYSETVQERFSRWQAEFTTSAAFNERLLSIDVTEVELKYLLSEDASSLKQRISSPPTWLTELEEVFDYCQTSEPLDLSPWATTEFFQVLEAFLRWGFQPVENTLHKLKAQYRENLPFNPDTIERILLDTIVWSLNGLLNRTLILEINVQRLQGKLIGDTPEERFENFINTLKELPQLFGFLSRYPVLARQIITHIKHQFLFMKEWVTHLCEDWELICQTFDRKPGVLEGVVANLGDYHGQGKSVLILSFSNHFKLVYKPRSLSIESHFQDLLRWVNANTTLPQFYTFRVLDRHSYGWTEFIEKRPCQSLDEIHRFYLRQGGYLALLYFLDAADFHSENLIAMGEHPVLIDLESLFHQRLELNTNANRLFDLPVNLSWGHSVIRTGFLPMRMLENLKGEGIDLSGLGTPEGQITPQEVPQVERQGTDDIRLIRKQITIPDLPNRPTYQGQPINVTDYQEDIVQGFTQVYHLILNAPDTFLSNIGAFAEDTIRVIPRMTRTYAVLLNESRHPDMLRDALRRDRLYDRLWLAVKDRPQLAYLISSERSDLSAGDIPIFTTKPNSCDLWDSRGQCFPMFFKSRTLEVVTERIQQLSLRDLERQIWFIRASLSTLIPEFHVYQVHTELERQAPLPSSTTIDSNELIRRAIELGDRLEILALKNEQSASWLGLNFTNDRSGNLMPMGTDLYNGLAGVILFLAYLHRVSGQKKYDVLARLSFHTFKLLLEQSATFLDSVGGFTGWGGILYTYCHLSYLWDDTSLKREIGTKLELLPELIMKDTGLDVLNGVAGLILCLATLRNEFDTTDLAILCAQRLVQMAKNTSDGVGWHSPNLGKRPLGGFSHGTAGIALALFYVADWSQSSEYHDLACEALRYDRSLFSVQHRNWLDLREFNGAGEPPPLVAWCHGAVGIGLSRLELMSFTQDAKDRQLLWEEIDIAMQTTLAFPYTSYNHSLCHGALGNLDFVMRIQNQASPRYSQTILADTLHSMEYNGYICGTPSGVETPGLMVGLAGIGYGLLRLAFPNIVPSILTLDTPYNLQHNEQSDHVFG